MSLIRSKSHDGATDMLGPEKSDKSSDKLSKSVGNSATPSEEQSVGPLQLFVPMFTYKTKEPENKPNPNKAESLESITVQIDENVNTGTKESENKPNKAESLESITIQIDENVSTGTNSCEQEPNLSLQS